MIDRFLVHDFRVFGEFLVREVSERLERKNEIFSMFTFYKMKLTYVFLNRKTYIYYYIYKIMSMFQLKLLIEYLKHEYSFYKTTS